ncbi:MAG: hypothetical protein IJK44_10920 [Bacteroidales bacterium]|nr:hypothetical protein [Bacteroidales bacterium]
MRKIITIIAAMSLAIVASAQGTAFEWLRISRNPAAAGMAGAGYASLVHGSAYSVNGNPAVAPLVDSKLSAGASFSLVPSGENTRGVTSAGASWRSGSFSVSAAYIGGKYPEVAFASDGGGEAGSFAPSDLMAGLGLGFAVGENLSFGANVRYALSLLTAKKSINTVNGDIAAMWKSGSLGVSAGVYCLGPKVKSGNTKYPAPASAKLSGNYALTFGDFALDLSADADYFFNGTIGFALGGNFEWNSIAYLRAGYCYGTPAGPDFKAAPVPSHFALGAGAKYFGVGLDLAVMIVPAAGTTICAGLSYGF